MKPYLAVLIDSFSEALSSRVLWILLAAWTLILAGLAPFGYIEEQSFEVKIADIKDREGFIKQLDTAVKGQGSDAQKRVGERLPQEAKDELKKYFEKKGEDRKSSQRGTIDSLVNSMNKLLEDRELYKAEAWPSADKRSNTKDLIATGTAALNEGQVKELNRRLIENAFSSSMKPTQGMGLWIGYAGFKMGNSLPITRSQANQFVEIFALTTIIKLGLGLVAIFVGIVVTAPLIPDMLQAGSLHLLLSKPISRSLLFLSKFLGGCIFVLLNIAYLLIGLYFIAGFRFDIWNEGLIAIIPVIAFVFVIFFSVSSLAGVIWKNAIVSVVITLVFWLVCFIVGTVREGFRPWAQQFPQAVHMQEVNGKFLSVSQSGFMQVWDEEKGVWIRAINNDGDAGRKLLGPVLIESSGQLVYATAGRGGFGFRGARGNLTIVDTKSKASVTDADPRRHFLWSDDQGPEVPEGVRQVFSWKGTMLALAESGIYKLDAEKLEATQNVPSSFFGISLPTKATNPFVRVSTAGWGSERPDSMAVTADGEQVWIYHRGTFEKLQWKEKEFVSEQIENLEGEASKIGVIAVGKTRGVIVREGEAPLVFNLDKPEVRTSATGIKPESPRQICSIGASDRFAILFQDGRVGILDADTLKYEEPAITGQGTATAIEEDASGKLWVAHSTRFFEQWDLAAGQSVKSLTVPRTTLQYIYDFAVNPLYIINPKPAALDETTQYLLQGKETLGISLDTTDVEQARAELDPWTPLWSNAIFVAVLLAISCCYLVRQEF
jgi:ABC-type transport system involved in multi-copper enzyme maturation permease subunit